MGFLSKLRRQDDAPELTCPRLPAAHRGRDDGVPQCGWDLREAYHRPTRWPAQSAPDPPRASRVIQPRQTEAAVAI